MYDDDDDDNPPYVYRVTIVSVLELVAFASRTHANNNKEQRSAIDLARRRGGLREGGEREKK